MLNINKKAFTLVELIVVITILAILWTIWFISLQWYSSEARDSKRITDLWQIRTGIQVYQAKEWVVPEPDETKTIIWSWTTNLVIQWYAWTWTLRNIKVNDDAKDPLEENYYTYTTNWSKTKFQLLTLLENNNTAYNNVIPTTYANYETRESYSIWDQLWTLLEPTTNIPLQELWNDIDLSVDTTEYSAVFNKNDIQILAWETLYNEIVARSNEAGVIDEKSTVIKSESLQIWSKNWKYVLIPISSNTTYLEASLNYYNICINNWFKVPGTTWDNSHCWWEEWSWINQNNNNIFWGTSGCNFSNTYKNSWLNYINSLKDDFNPNTRIHFAWYTDVSYDLCWSSPSRPDYNWNSFFWLSCSNTWYMRGYNNTNDIWSSFTSVWINNQSEWHNNTWEQFIMCIE